MTTPTATAISESQLWKKRLGDWVVNPYIGCEHGCFHCYCPSMPGVKFFNDGHSQRDWGKYIWPKPGFVDALKRQLKTFTPSRAVRTPDWGKGWILLSFLTDCYTPVEGKHKITRQCLQLLLEAGHKVRIQTRSALVERDFDILKRHPNQVRLGTSLPYLDDKLARILEPRAAAPNRRVKMLEKATNAGITTFISAAPFMPWSEWQGDLVNVFNIAARLNSMEVFCEVLNPKGENLEMMLEALLMADRGYEYHILKKYDVESWASFTCEVLAGAARTFPDLPWPEFIPWPDTGRRWAKHMTAEQTAWLDQWLPPKAAFAESKT